MRLYGDYIHFTIFYERYVYCVHKAKKGPKFRMKSFQEKVCFFKGAGSPWNSETCQLADIYLCGQEKERKVAKYV
jgi:hypothetical protein